jgi:NitT/TauT family transport system ATP-binding protein
MTTRVAPGPEPDLQQPAPAAAIWLEAVRKTYPRRRGAPVVALADFTLAVASGEVVAVVGPSGCGKTTLLELVCGLSAPDAGTVRTEAAALMPQSDLLLPWLSALDNAALSLRARPRHPGQGPSRAQARERARALLETFGLADFASARPYELSGGMRQRVAFVRTLLAGKRVLCLDEPFGALDAITRQEMQAWLGDALERERHLEGARPTVLLVTHDVEEAVVLADRVAVMSPRPGHVVTELDVDLPRPRERTDPQIGDLRQRAMEALR